MTATKWRVGQHYGIHVYEGEVPVCTALTAEFARRIVDDHNAAPRFGTYGERVMPDTRTLDRLYLEWSQFTGARTSRELELERRAAMDRAQLEAVDDKLNWQYTGQGRIDRIEELLAVEARVKGREHAAAEAVRNKAGHIGTTRWFREPGWNEAIAWYRQQILDLDLEPILTGGLPDAVRPAPAREPAAGAAAPDPAAGE